MPFETAAYYLFSSILQADAAIIGIGIVLAVYRLQSIDEKIQTALHLLQSLDQYSAKIAPLVRQILDSGDATAAGSALRQYLNWPYYNQLELLVTGPLQAADIRRKAMRALRLISIQMTILAFGILTVPFLRNALWWGFLPSISGVVVIYFAASLRVTVTTAKAIMPQQGDFDLKILNPKVYDLAHS